MKTILAMLFVTVTLCSAAQDTPIVRLEYFIDSDPGPGNAIPVNIPAAPDVTFLFTIHLTGYSIGYHKLYLRTKDTLGKWSLTARTNIEVLNAPVPKNVVRGEYFIDEDPGFGAASTINVSAPDTAILENFSAATTGLTEGYHKLYGRFKDAYGAWGLTFRRNIEIIKGENNKVVNGEYFFRTDNGFGDCTPIVFTTPSADGTFSFNILKNQIPGDNDTLFIRVRDDIETRWSLTTWNDSLFNSILPLTIVSFTATKHINTAQVNWQTTNEINTAGFNIQRSTDGVHFTNVGVVPANNTSGSIINNYSYSDNITGISAREIYYRLQQVDLDGKGQYSSIALIHNDVVAGRLRITPNPAKDYINIIPANPRDVSGAIITIIDMAGHITLKQSLSASDKQQINVSALAKGLYIITVVKPTGYETQKLLKE